MAHLRDIVNTPMSCKRSRADSSPSFTDFSPIGMEDLEALNMLEAKYTEASSPLSRKRKRTTPSIGASSPINPSQVKSSDAEKVVKAARGPLLDVTAPVNGAKPVSQKESTSTPKASKPEPISAAAKGKQREVTPDEFENEFDDLGDAFAEPEPDYDSWFQPATGPIPAMVGFVRPSKDPRAGPAKFIQPSAAALQAAKKLISEVEKEPELTDATSAVDTKPAPVPFKPPTASTVPKPTQDRAQPAPTISTPIPSVPVKAIEPAPVISRPVAPGMVERSFEYHPSHPASKSSETLAVATKDDAKSSINHTPARKATPQPSSDGLNPTPRHLGMRSRPRGPTRSKFATPWKKGADMPLTQETPSKPASSVQYHQPRSSLGGTSKPSTSKPSPRKEPKYIEPLPTSVFDLNPPRPRTKLSSLTVAKRRDMKAVVDTGISQDVGNVDSWSAEYWVFEDEDGKHGWQAAYQEMKQKGCSLATEEWVVNHWVLILWKLANMVVLWPKSQASRWSFNEVLNQLLYRYERELNRGERPAVRLIQERDASPNSTIVLYVFDVLPPAKGSPDGTLPELVLTDGWYKIRAQIDVTLERAIKKRKIRAGTKLEIIGAKLNAHRKDAEEVLKSFKLSSLIISGNGTHLAPWHAKLGFKQRPSIPTLNSLTTEGGIVPLLFVTVHNILPLYYAEGRTIRDTEEEKTARAAWQKGREAEEATLRTEMCKALEKMEGLIDRLETIAGSKLSRIQASDDSPPDDTETRVDDLEESEDQKSILKGLDSTTAAWMAVFLRQKYLRQQETMVMDIESELASSFPARNVRSFRILVVKDARTQKKPANRSCQVTVWDVEGMEGVFVEGKTYMVTNLVPTIPKAWIATEVFLSTRRDTQWRRVYLPKPPAP